MFLNETTFQLEIEQMVKEKRINHLDAVIEYCTINGIDPEDVAKLISSNLKGKIKMAAMEDGLMKVESRLPI